VVVNPGLSRAERGAYLAADVNCVILGILEMCENWWIKIATEEHSGDKISRSMEPLREGRRQREGESISLDEGFNPDFSPELIIICRRRCRRFDVGGEASAEFQ
jgi:hypothetical protein